MFLSEDSNNQYIEAAKRGEIEKLLLVENTDIIARDSEGMTALIWAARRGQKRAIDALLFRKPNLEIDIKDKNGWTALIWAARKGYKNIVELLLNNGANPNLKDIYGWSAMIWALRSGYFNIFRLLKKAGAER
jgi:ankyrin repeat protein